MRRLALAGLLALAACSKDPPPAAPALAPSTPPPASVAAAAAAPQAPAAPAAAADPLVGQPAPDFTATAQDGSSVHLSSLRGKPVVVYFYPKDETPGCTTEACSFRDAWTPLAKSGAVLVGVSADTLESHRAFVAHYKLPFLLVSDPDGQVAQLFGVPFQGHHARQTFVIGPDGKVTNVYRQVDVTQHAAQVLGDLSRLPHA